METVRDWMVELSGGVTSTEQDDTKMQLFLRSIDFHKAICTCGIVYLDGKGTIDAPPISIQSMAEIIAKVK